MPTTAFDVRADLAYSQVATPPTPSTSGVALTVLPGQGAFFGTQAPFWVTVWPPAASPSPINATLLRVTAVNGDTFTLDRSQDKLARRTFQVGDQIMAPLTAETLETIQAAINALETTTGGLGTAATHNVSDFDTAGAAATAQAASLQKASNLGDVASAVTARTNLGLGTAATHAATDFDTAGAAAAAAATETTRAQAAEQTNATAISNEIARAQGVEAAKAPIASPTFIPTGQTLIGATLKAAGTSQTGDLLTAQDSTGTAHVRITAATPTTAANLVVGAGALATNATSGFVYVPTMAGRPSGTPGAVGGSSPLAFSSSTNELVAYNFVTSAWQRIGASYSVMMPPPSGDQTGATDSANFAAAVTNTPVGGRLYIPDPGGQLYYINAPIVLNKQISIEGNSLTTTDTPAGTNQVSGVIIQQQTLATDAMQITVSGGGQSVNLRNFCLAFKPGLAITGHGINSTPALNGAGPTHQLGHNNSAWDNLCVTGHDGTHYAYNLVNYVNLDARRCIWYGGGGYLITADNTTSNSCNAWFYNCFGQTNTTAGSTAHAWAFSSANAPGSATGCVSFITFVKPGATVATNANGQLLWNDRAGAADPWGLRIIAEDLEGGAGKVFGIDTQIIGQLSTGSTGNSLGYGSHALGGTVGQFNSAFGHSAMSSQPSGTQNTAIGYNALAANTTASQNTAIGASALVATTTGGVNTAIGFNALAANTTQANNVAIGYSALATATAANNTAIGFQAGKSITTGHDVTLIGANAGSLASTGLYTVAIGSNCLSALTTASYNVGVGTSTLAHATTGAQNVAIGFQALNLLTTGGTQTAIGNTAMQSATTGTDNTAIGSGAGYNAGGVTANATVAGSWNTWVGANTGPTSAGDPTGCTAIGRNALAGGGNNATAIGVATSAGAAGAVAIGADSGGAGAATTTANAIALGTANHKVQISNNATGAGSAALGANCPAVTATGPYTWLRLLSSDGSTVYVPAWK